jgi:hypothetical protein
MLHAPDLLLRGTTQHMRTEDLLEQCLQALTSGQELPPDVARYLARHPEQRAELEDLLAVAQRASRLPSAELSHSARSNMQQRLAARLGFDPSLLDAPVPLAPAHDQEQNTGPHPRRRKKPVLSLGRLSLARLRYAPPTSPADDISEARIREAFRDLTPEDIRRYIGVRGEDYLYYRQRLPGWQPVFAFIAAVLRGFKRLEKLMATDLSQ